MTTNEEIAQALEDLAESEFLSYRISDTTGMPEQYPRKKFSYSDRTWIKAKAAEYRADV